MLLFSIVNTEDEAHAPQYAFNLWEAGESDLWTLTVELHEDGLPVTIEALDYDSLCNAMSSAHLILSGAKSVEDLIAGAICIGAKLADVFEAKKP